MQWSTSVFVVLFAPYASALLRFPCSQLVTQRFDPLVTPGHVSPHVHQIIGGNAFNLTMDANNDLPDLSTCTTCRFKEDFSNYWTAVMYFKHPNGSFLRVPQVANGGTGAPNGGMTVYYIQPPSGEKVVAFKKGFRMIVGDPMLRTKNVDKNSVAWHTSTFRCWEQLNMSGPGSQYEPGAGLDTIELPKKKCPGGIRSNIYFPSCWDGVNLDTPSHHDHVAYPTGGLDGAGSIFYAPGQCPSTHPVRLPLIFTETIWDTGRFDNMWPADGGQPFVYSMGDPTGAGQHADYVFGWEGDSLQRAMDTCNDRGDYPSSCKALTIQTDQEMNSCYQTPRINEVTEGQYIDALPGCNPIQKGPNPATMVSNCQAISTIENVPAPTQPPLVTTPNLPSATPLPTTNVPAVPPPPTSASPIAPLQTHSGQCGGQGWSGASQCQSPYSCKAQNQWYSQCT
ncbi:hypothetical protein CPB83DRAFT_799362 [Crepidotus variabilis]|uniref:CBM1 domain-containing protein n=1 Tax=Crepidotus variabilis TaxID=179855 RepID=A0A9P6JK28_9AGAR|nr:hypothetical protein CPB83DRAFT_799362 [Crepidotus variabilis]